MAFAVQTADEAQSPVRHKVEIAHWLETGLWVNPHALLFGALIFLAGAVLYATIGSQSQTLRYVAISGSSLVLGATITIFFIDAATRFPQQPLASLGSPTAPLAPVNREEAHTFIVEGTIAEISE